MSSQSRSPARCLLVWSTATALTALLVAPLVADLADFPAAASAAQFDDLVVAGCELAAVVAAGWLWLLVSLVVRDAVHGRAGRRRAGVPAVVRRVVLAGCGLGLATGIGLPAQADPGADDRPAVASLLAGLPLPDRMTTTQWLGQLARDPAARSIRASHPGGGPDQVVVRSGDSLWTLAAGDLPAAASDADISRRWREIYAANRPVIGPDPDLIVPGQRLLLPSPTDPTDRADR